MVHLLLTPTGGLELKGNFLITGKKWKQVWNAFETVRTPNETEADFIPCVSLQPGQLWALSFLEGKKQNVRCQVTLAFVPSCSKHTMDCLFAQGKARHERSFRSMQIPLSRVQVSRIIWCLRHSAASFGTTRLMVCGAVERWNDSQLPLLSLRIPFDEIWYGKLIIA